MVVEREKKNSNSKKAPKFFSKKYLALAVAAVATGILPVDMSQQVDSNQNVSRNPLRWAINAANKIASMFGSQSASAAALTWNGASATNGNWTNNGNWSTTSPTSGANDIHIASVGNWSTINNDETTNFQIQSLTFDNTLTGSVVLNGNQIAINTGTNSITNSSSFLQTINAVMYENANAITINGGTAGLLFGSGFLTNTSNTITIQGKVTFAAGIGTSASTWAPISISSGANFTFGSSSYAGQTISDVLSGSGTLTFQGGSGTTTAFDLGNTLNNTGFTGPMIINSARVHAGSANALTNASSITVNANGQLYLDGGVTYSRPLTLNGSGWADGLGALRLDSGSTYSGSITLTANSTINSQFGGTNTVSGNIALGANTLTLSITNVGPLTASGIMSGTGGVIVSAVSGQTITLSGSNTYTGATAINSGVLKAGVAGVAGTNGALGLNSAVTLANTAGASLNITGFNTQIGSLTGGGATGGSITLGAATLTVGGDNTSQAAYAGIISGTGGALTKIGTGTLILTGTNTYTGGTTISNGLLSFANSALSSSGNITMNGGALQWNGSNTQDVSARLAMVNATNAIFDTNGNSVTLGTNFGSSTSGLLTKIGAGTLTLTGTNTFSGAVAVQNGMLSFNSLAAAGSAQPLGEGNTVNLGVAFTSSGKLQYTGAAGTLTQSIYVLGNGSDTIQNAGSGLLTLSGTLTKYGTTLTLAAGSTAGITVTGPIVGAIAGSDLVVTGGTVTLSGTNTYGGNTFVNTGGYLLDGINNGMPTTTTLTLGEAIGNTNGTFDLGGFNQTVAGLASAGTGTLTITNSSATTNGTLTFSGGTSSFGGFIKDGSSKTTAMIVSAGTLTLGGANTYTGGTTVSAGTLQIGNATALGGNASAVSVTGGAVLDLNGTTMTGTNTLTLNGTGVNNGGALINSNATAGTYAGLIKVGSASSIVAGTGNITISNVGTITGATFGLTLDGSSSGSIASIIGTTTGTVTKNGTGTWTLSGANTYTGTTTVNAGTLVLNPTTVTSNIDLAAAVITGTLDLNWASNSSDSWRLTSPITGSGTLIKDGAGWIDTSGAGVFTNFAGNIIINNGILGNGFLNATWTNSTTGVTINSPGLFDLRGNANATILSTLSGTGDVVNSQSSAANLTVGANNASSTFGGVIHGNGTGTNINASGVAYTSASAEAGTTSLTKIGTGTITLTGVNTFTGRTTVNGGVLQIGNGTSGSLTGTSALTLGGGTLSILGKSSGSTAQTLASLTLTAGTASSIILTPNGGSGTTLTLTSNTLNTGANSAVNFNYAAGTTNGTLTINAVVAWNPSLTSGIIGGGYSVTDTGGTGFATVVGSKVVRLTDPGSAGLPLTTGSASTNYFNNSTYSTSSTSTAGSLVEALTGNVVANTDTIDTTGLTTGANLALGAFTLTLTSGGGMAFSGANPYTITGTGGLITSGAAGQMNFNNYNSSTVTISAAILNNSSSTVAINGTGTLVFSGTNTYAGGTYLNGGVLSVGTIADSGTSNIGTAGTLNLDGGTLLFTGANGTSARAVSIANPSTINVANGGTLVLTGTGSGGGGLTVNGTGTLQLDITAGTNDRLFIGTTTSDIGSLTVNSGTLNVTRAYIVMGQNSGGSTALFTINGGTVNHTGTGGLYLDISSGENSIFTVNGGSYVDAGSLVLGNAGGHTAAVNLNNSGSIIFSGTGTQYINNSTDTVTWTQTGGNAYLGGQTQMVNSTGNATVNLSGGAFAVNSNFYMGYTGAGTATWNQTGGTLFVNGVFQENNSGSSAINISGGTATVLSTLYVGVNGTGTLTISNNAFVFPQALQVGYNPGGVGTLNISGGELYVAANVTYIGASGAGIGTFNQTGGMTVLTNQVNLANGTGTGTMNFSGGTFIENAGNFLVGVGTGAATVNISGTALVSLAQLSFNYQTGSSANVNLNGGTLRVFADVYGVGNSGGLGTMTLNGGTFQAGATFSTPSQVVNVVNNGGAIFDTQSYNITVTSPLTAGTSSIGGLTKYGAGSLILNPTTSGTYIGATTINGGTLLLDFTNMTATNPANVLGSTSVLNLNNGSILSIKGKATGVTTQTLGNLILNNGGGIIVLTPNSGTATTLTLGNTWTNNNNSTLLVDESAAGTSALASSPSYSGNFMPWVTVKTSTAFGFGTVVSGIVVPYTTATNPLPGSLSLSTVDYSLAGGTALLASQTVTASETANSLVIAPTASSLSLAINSGQVLSFTTGAVAFNGVSAYSITGPGQFGGSNSTLTLSTYGTNALTISAHIGSGTGMLVLGGSGKTIISGSNSYSGGTQFNSGTLSLGNANAIGSGTLTINGGTIDASTTTTLANNPQTWNGNFAFTGTSALNMGTGNITLGNNVQITNNGATANTLTLGGSISGRLWAGHRRARAQSN